MMFYTHHKKKKIKNMKHPASKIERQSWNCQKDRVA